MFKIPKYNGIYDSLVMNNERIEDDFQKCNFNNVTFKNCVFVYIHFKDCKFTNIKFENCLFPDVKFKRCEFDNCVFDDCIHDFYIHVFICGKGYYVDGFKSKCIIKNTTFYIKDLDNHKNKTYANIDLNTNTTCTKNNVKCSFK